VTVSLVRLPAASKAYWWRRTFAPALGRVRLTYPRQSVVGGGDAPGVVAAIGLADALGSGRAVVSRRPAAS